MSTENRLSNQLLLSGLSNTSSLRKTDATEIKDRSAANPTALLDSPDFIEEEEARWKYFFDTGCENWFELIKNQTFTSTFCSLTQEEARIIVNHWEMRGQILTAAAAVACDADEDNDGSSVNTQLQQELQQVRNDAVDGLSALLVRLNNAVSEECRTSPCGRAFVKLSTRSPKDAKIILQKATVCFEQRVHNLKQEETQAGAETGVGEDTVVDENLKWIILSEEVTKASSVSSASEAIDLLLDSTRVFEDLEYALKGPPDTLPSQPQSATPTAATSEAVSESANGDDCITREWKMNLVARAWDPRLKPSSEFRGICWDNKLTCLAQYFHPLYFKELHAKGVKDQIESDIMVSFEHARTAVAQLGGNCIIDFAWLGEGEVVIVELNPFDGVCLGTFPASTGLFLFEDPEDQKVMKGEAPFEFRIRDSKMSTAQLRSNGNSEWRDIIKNSTV